MTFGETLHIAPFILIGIGFAYYFIARPKKNKTS